MNSKLIKTLSVICLILILVITLEQYYASYRKEQLLSVEISTIKPTEIDEMPSINLNSQPEISYTDVVNRPLFIAGRKPVSNVEQTQASAPVIPMTDIVDLQLNGIYTTKKGLTALISRTAAKTPADKYIKVIVGGNIDGWKVTDVHPDKIILTQGSTQKDLLLYKPKEIKDPNGTIPLNSGVTQITTPESKNDTSE
jgi:hypothetical protein